MGDCCNSKLENQYDAEYTFGNTKVFVVAPKITEEENQRRWQHVCEVASEIVKSMMDKE